MADVDLLDQMRRTKRSHTSGDKDRPSAQTFGKVVPRRDLHTDFRFQPQGLSLSSQDFGNAHFAGHSQP
jgi:hypothetical protein